MFPSLGLNDESQFDVGRGEANAADSEEVFDVFYLFDLVHVVLDFCLEVREAWRRFLRVFRGIDELVNNFFPFPFPQFMMFMETLEYDEKWVPLKENGLENLVLIDYLNSAKSEHGDLVKFFNVT